MNKHIFNKDFVAIENSSSQPLIIDTRTLGYDADDLKRQRIIQSEVEFEFNSTLGLGRKFTDTVANDGTVSANATNSYISLAVLDSGDTALRRSKHNISGRAKTGILSAVLAVANVANITSRIGLYHAVDGVFFEFSNQSVFIVLRRNSVDTKVAQTDWNKDKLDGTGISKLIADFHSGLDYYFDIRIGFASIDVGVILQNVVRIAHSFYLGGQTDNSLKLAIPHFVCASFPVSFELISTGGVGELRHSSGRVMIEGEKPAYAERFTIGNFLTPHVLTTLDQYVAICSIRLRSNDVNTLWNLTTVRILSINMINSGGSASTIVRQLRRNIVPHESDTSVFANIDTTNSAVQFRVHDDNLAITGGEIVRSGFLEARSELIQEISDTSQIFLDVGDTLTIVCAKIDGVNPNVFASFNWSETI